MEHIKLDLAIVRTPVEVGEGKVVYLDLKDTAVLERAESQYERMSQIMAELTPPENMNNQSALTHVAQVIRQANLAAKEAIDYIFDGEIAQTIWGNSSCIALGDTVDNSRFSRAVGALLTLYAPAIEAMGKEIERTSDALVAEVLEHEAVSQG